MARDQGQRSTCQEISQANAWKGAAAYSLAQYVLAGATIFLRRGFHKIHPISHAPKHRFSMILTLGIGAAPSVDDASMQVASHGWAGLDSLDLHRSVNYYPGGTDSI